MAYGVMGFKTFQAPTIFLPSPSIWADGVGEEYKNEGVGYHVLADWKAGLGQVLNTSTTGASGPTITYDNNYDSVIKLTTSTGIGALGLNGIGIYTRPMGNTVLFSQNKLKMETIVAPQQNPASSTSTATAGFIGFGALHAISTAAFITSISATNGSTTFDSTSVVGFLHHADADGNWDAIYQNGSTSTLVLANVFGSNVFTTTSVQTQLQGAQTGTGIQPPAAPTWSTSTFVKFGVIFDGIANTWAWFVQGLQVAKVSAVGTTDNSTSYGAFISYDAATSTTAALDVAYFRTSYGPGM